MQPNLAPALHNLRPAEDVSDQNVQQALMMANHQLMPDNQAQQAAFLDHHQHQDVMSPSTDGNKRTTGKRELSTSKRAAQNRAAQRAFRQRKEGHIKKLEEQVRDYANVIETLKATQAENYQLRDYIINLQSRLIESQRDFPPVPGNIDLSARPAGVIEHHGGHDVDGGAGIGDDVVIGSAGTGGEVDASAEEAAALGLAVQDAVGDAVSGVAGEGGAGHVHGGEEDNEAA